MPQKMFSRSIEIEAPAELVWEVLCQVEQWPEWTESVERIEPVTPGALQVGGQLKIRQPKFPPTIWTVRALDPGRGMLLTAGALGARVQAHHTVAALPGNTSRATLSIRFQGLLAAPLALLTRRINERYLEYEATGLKKRCEFLGTAMSAV